MGAYTECVSIEKWFSIKYLTIGSVKKIFWGAMCACQKFIVSMIEQMIYKQQIKIYLLIFLYSKFYVHEYEYFHQIPLYLLPTNGGN